VVLGLGYLTKQIQLVFPLMLLVFLALQPRGGKGHGWGGWLAAVGVSLLFLVPPLLWNWRHDWITFRHTADEIESVAFQWGRSLRFVGEFLGGQAGLGGGVNWGLMMLAGGLGLARWRVMSGRERYLLLFFVPGWAAYAGLAMHQRVEQNWPLVFYPAAAVLVAGWAWGSDAGRRWRRWVGVGVGVGGVLAGMLMAVPFVAPAMPWAGERKDPTARVRGWRELAERVEVLRAGLSRPERTFLLAPGDRYVASALAFYLADRPRTYCWEEPGRPVSQYGIWGRPDGEKRGWDALIIERDGDSPRVRELKDRFETWESKGVLEVRLGPGLAAVRRYRVFLGGGFLGGGDGIGGGG
jgi:hypothetical protein